jgi:hypothetical protein
MHRKTRKIIIRRSCFVLAVVNMQQPHIEGHANVLQASKTSSPINAIEFSPAIWLPFQVKCSWSSPAEPFLFSGLAGAMTIYFLPLIESWDIGKLALAQYSLVCFISIAGNTAMFQSRSWSWNHTMLACKQNKIFILLIKLLYLCRQGSCLYTTAST